MKKKLHFSLQWYWTQYSIHVNAIDWIANTRNIYTLIRIHHENKKSNIVWFGHVVKLAAHYNGLRALRLQTNECHHNSKPFIIQHFLTNDVSRLCRKKHSHTLPVYIKYYEFSMVGVGMTQFAAIRRGDEYFCKERRYYRPCFYFWLLFTSRASISNIN